MQQRPAGSLRPGSGCQRGRGYRALAGWRRGGVSRVPRRSENHLAKRRGLPEGRAMTSPLVKKVLLVAAGACLAGGIAVYLAYRRPSPSPPAVARDGIEPAVWTAIDNARQAVQESPRSADAWGRLGMARSSLALGQDRDCLQHLSFALASPFTRKAAYSLQASVHERLGEPKTAEEDARKAAQAPPDRPWPNPFAAELARLRMDRRSRLTQAAQWTEQGHAREGLALLNELVQEEPDFVQAWLALGHACLQLGDYARAEQALDVALRLAPDPAAGHFYRGCLASDRGKPATAGACFRPPVG